MNCKYCNGYMSHIIDFGGGNPIHYYKCATCGYEIEPKPYKIGDGETESAKDQKQRPVKRFKKKKKI